MPTRSSRSSLWRRLPSAAHRVPRHALDKSPMLFSQTRRKTHATQPRQRPSDSEKEESAVCAQIAAACARGKRALTRTCVPNRSWCAVGMLSRAPQGCQWSRAC
jgi:hypothetical protein